MGQGTIIEWTDATWNPGRGCNPISPGCKNCYAMKLAARFSQPGLWGHGYARMTPHGPKWTGKVSLIEEMLDRPVHWKRPKKVFVNSMSDVFHEDMHWDWIDRIFDVMIACPQHSFQILTKRPDNMLAYMKAVGNRGSRPMWPPPNVWLGASVESPEYLYRIDLVRQTPAAVRFLSIEPLIERLGPLNLSGIDWVIVGCESGTGPRPMEEDWVREIRDECVKQGVRFFLKQMMGHNPRTGRRKVLKTPPLDGKRWRQFPLKRKIRSFHISLAEQKVESVPQ